MESAMELEVLDPLIYVYHDAFPDTDEFIRRVEEINEWHPWYTFGEQTFLGGHPYLYNSFPDKDLWDKNMQECYSIMKRNHILYPVQDIFYETTKDYVEKTGSYLPNWMQMNPGVCKYFENGGIGFSDLAMHYHTDYQQEDSQAPGHKFGLTCTMYLNDNYEGGEISFKIFDEDDIGFKLIDYKPTAGDVIVFPAGPPYYHGVKKVTSGEKYFIRTNWCYMYEGDPEWLANREKYGEELWAEMEQARKKEGYQNGRWTRD
jgi:hypothetical protein